ncbi:MAG: ABC transporter ATP-binding protein [Caldilineaceae bacterium SB0665_bin_21]|nr:ABC transporter ATP-binding protein [Caldilineaceae bacterium SB0665_bin_21]MYC62727.1 ABC transporter ATP-binding protein [Caldilineaceae bacterium SB0661_bin_34]
MNDNNQRPEDVATRQGLVHRIAGTFQPYWVRVGLVGILILITAGLGVVNPVLIRFVFDSALFPPEGEPNLSLLWLVASIMAGITVLNGGLGVVQTLFTNRIGQQVMRDLRDRLYTHLQMLPLSFFTNTRTGEIQSRVANDVGSIQNVVTSTVSNVLSNSVVFISTLVAMFILSWEIALVSIATVPVFALLSKTVGARRRAVSAEAQQTAADMTAITQETLSISGIMLAKLFGRQDQEIERFHRQNQRLADLTIRRQMTGQAFFTVMQIFFSLAPVLVYVIAGYLLRGDAPSGITSGTIVAFTTLQSRLFFPIGSLLQVSVELQSSLALFERIFGYLDIKPEIVDAPGALPLDRHAVKGRITFDRVRLEYEARAEATDHGSQGRDSEQRWALDDVSFRIEPGQLAAFIGPSGAGKTTISYLIPRLYDVTEGAVLIDGNDVRDIQLASLADLVGYVTQESYLFHASLRDNLLYGNPDATRDEMEEAARAAFIHERIMQFPDGYDTVVGERGYRLSGGERQRLSIARVILHDPRILILDEATSALDTASERYVQAALEPLMDRCTTIAIAHRLSTIMSADVIFGVDQGRIVEQGTHQELLTRDGLYANLYAEQFDAGRIECRCEDGIVLSNGRIVAQCEEVL